MSYEKKMKDLLARLVAMSPEPPPYPEESPMAASVPPRKRVHPALVFAGAVAVVAALAVPVVLLTNDPPPAAVGSTTTTTTTVVTTTLADPETTSSTVETTTTTQPSTTTTVAATTWEGTIYLYQTPENSFLGNPALVPISVEVTDLSGGLAADAPFTEALAALGPDLPELPADASLANAVPAEVQIVSQTSTETDTGHLLTFDMNEAFLDGAGGLLADFTMLNQLIYTMTEPFLEDAEVMFTVNGEPVDAFGSEGLDLTEPANRETFEDELALIYLTEPVVKAGDTYRVEGMANVFEASLIVQVVDGNGEIVHEEPVMATCGSGCWGTFSADIDAGLITPGESSVRALTYSAEDGSPVDVVTVPVPDGDIWQLTIG